MTNTEKFFVECVRRGINNESIENIPNDLDYKKLYKLCISHSMSVVVFSALEKIKDRLMPEFLSALQHLVQRYVMLDIQSEYDKEKFLSAMEERGLKHMPLKGYHLKMLYPSTEMRFASDCDVLIDVAQLKEVRALVKELGLQTKSRDTHHDIVYYSETKTILELHKCLFVGELEKYFGVGFERARLKEGKKSFYELSPEDFYATMLGHSAYHFADGAGVGIRHLTDIYLYKKTYKLDYGYLDIELKKCGLLKFKNEFEKLANYFFGDAIVDEDTKYLAKHILESSLFTNEEKKVASQVATNIDEKNDSRARSKTFWKKIFPSRELMQFSYPILKKAIWLLPLFYPIRWFCVLFTRPKNIKQLNKYANVTESQLNEMKEIREMLGIEHI